MPNDDPQPATTADPVTHPLEFRRSAKFSALHQALDHAKATGERDAKAVIAYAEEFWQWLVKEVA